MLPLRLKRFLLAVLLLIMSASVRAAPVEVLPDGAKIIVIGGALTEIVYALEAGERIIGRDTTSSYPEEVLALPDVGYMRALSPEGVLSLEPQALLLSEGSGPPQALEVLQKLSLPMVMVAENYSRAGVLRKITTVGHALGREAQAQALIQAVEQDFTKVDRLLDHIVEKKRVLFVLSIQNGRIMAAGRDTAADAMIALAGGINAVNGFSGYKLINDEALIEAAPDFILSMKNGGGHVVADQLLEIPAVQATPAAKNNNIHQMDGLFLLGFGPRAGQAAYELALLLYGAVDEAALERFPKSGNQSLDKKRGKNKKLEWLPKRLIAAIKVKSALGKFSAQSGGQLCANTNSESMKSIQKSRIGALTKS